MRLQSARQRTQSNLPKVPVVSALQVTKMAKISTLLVMLLVVACVAGTTTARDLPGVSGKFALLTPALPCCVIEHQRYSS